jgi:hypothetical protein
MMKHLFNAVILIAFLFLGYFPDFVVRANWGELCVANKIFRGNWGFLTMYILDILPTILIYLFLGLAFYLIIISEGKTLLCWILSLGIFVTILKIIFTKYGFSEKASVVDYIYQYSQIIIPFSAIIVGASLGRVTRKLLKMHYR